MTSFVRSRLEVSISADTVSPLSCPYASYDLPEGLRVRKFRCWDNDPFLGERYCRYYLWAAHNDRPTERIASLRHLANGQADAVQTDRSVLVWCQLAIPGEVIAGV